MNTAEFLQISAALVPEREALVGDSGRLSFLDTAGRVNRLTNALAGRGVTAGSAVAVMALNAPEFVETYYACSKLGATFVPLNYRAKHEEIAYMLENSEASVVFASKRYVDILRGLGDLPGVRLSICYDEAVDGMEAFESFLASGTDEEVFVDVQDSDANILMYTSGTTAMPKGVVLTYGDITAYVINTMEPASPEEPHNVTLVSVPLYHIAGATTMASSIFGGRTLVIPPQFDPGRWLELVEKERVTHSFVVPTMLKRIMEHPSFEQTDLSSLKLVAYGAAPMPYEVVRKAVEVFPPNAGLMNAYGQTESTSALTFLGPDDHRIEGTDEEKEQKYARLRSVGQAMPDVALVIMDEEGNLLPPNQEGEICAMSGRLMKEYHKLEGETQQAIQDGWLHTGDVGYLDDDGYLFITGRIKDMIIRGGENIAAGEVEAAIESNPKVDEAAVIGVKDVEWGEEVKAIVVLKKGEHATPEEIAAYTKERIASFKAPKYVTFVSELPRSYVGKVLKNDLRKLHGEPVSESAQGAKAGA
ncbi:MAG: long-chain-fatty-acid--CoA ligase [Dehalococcoidia bacterium]|nr:long-chain-fatty-acid--CoA ligase [Dehalococcoidia bacterium]